MNYSKIGAQLQLVRERKGLSHQQVFEVTRIQPSILRDIEEGTVNIAPVFLKSFIKTYCQFLGLDFEKLEKDAIEETQEKNEGQFIDGSKKIEPGTQNYKAKNIFRYIVPVLVVVTLFQIMNFFKLPKKLFTESPQEMNTSEVSSLNPEEETAPPQPELSEDEEEEQPALDDSLLGQIKNSVFNHEILIQSSQKLNIYFKTDNRFTLNKALSPFVWFSIKAEESIYLRFEEKQGKIQIFYNGEQVDLGSNSFFERKFE